MTTPAPLESWRSIVTKLFPWLAYVAPASDGGLSLRAAAAKLLHLQGDAGDPAVARVGDTCGRLALDLSDPMLPTLYYSPDPAPSPTAIWLPVPITVGPPAPGVFAGLQIKIATGSQRVTSG